MTESQAVCPACGSSLLKGGTAAGLCPRCILKELCSSSFAGGALSQQMVHGSGDAGKDVEFDLIEEIGVGAFGAVYRGFDRQLDREVAVKILRAANVDPAVARERFLAESTITAGLEHPSIVPIHSRGRQPDGSDFYTMKLLEGETLAALLRRMSESARPYEEVSLPRLLHMFVQVCDAVSFAHARGVIHRDLKPGNIMLGSFNEVYVVDWGLAKIVNQEEVGAARNADESVESSTKERTPTKPPDEAGHAGLWFPPAALMSRSATITGTPAYMSPEQADGRAAEVGRRSDVYSLGAILYEILALAPPVAGSSMDEVVEHVRSGMITPLSATRHGAAAPAELAAIAMKALACEPADRYPGVAALANDVRACLEDREVSVFPDGLLRKAVKWVRRHPAPAAAIMSGAGLLLLSALVAAFLIGAEQKKTTAALREVQAQRDRAQIAERRAAADRDNAIAVNLELKLQVLQANLAARNRGYDLGGVFTLENGAVVEADFGGCRLDDISALKDLNLRRLNLEGTRVWDLAPLEGQPITVLNLQGSGVSEMGPVAALRGLEELRMDALRHMESLDKLRSHKRLKSISGVSGEAPMPAADFWRRYDAWAYRSDFQREYATAQNLPLKRAIRLPGGVTLTTILIPPGEFTMGGKYPETTRFDGETILPRHTVQIAGPFYLGVWEVTQEQVESLVGATPSIFIDTPGSKRKPADSLNADLIISIVLPALQKYAPPGMRFRLPSEAEWEYACRAGTKTQFCFGDVMTSDQANFSASTPDLDAVVGRTRGEPTVCGMFPPNAWGLHDMHGNVMEWCADTYGTVPELYRRMNTAMFEDVEIPAPESRMVRGGAYRTPLAGCSSFSRWWKSPAYKHPSMGFRVALSPEDGRTAGEVAEPETSTP